MPEDAEAAAAAEAAGTAAAGRPAPAQAASGPEAAGGGSAARPDPAESQGVPGADGNEAEKPAARDTHADAPAAGGEVGGAERPAAPVAGGDGAEGEGGEDAEQQEEEEAEPPGPQLPNLLLFRRWDLDGIEVRDPGLVSAISLRRMILPYTYGRSALKKFNKADANIVERLANKMMHFGKRYAKNTGRMAGKKTSVLRTVEAAFEIIHLQTGRNPVEVLVRAVEHSAPNEDTTRIVYGGAVYHVSVDVSPLRRVDLALRFIADGVKEAAFSRPRAVEECLADHLMLAAANDQNAPSVKKKHELERIAQASR